MTEKLFIRTAIWLCLKLRFYPASQKESIMRQFFLELPFSLRAEDRKQTAEG